MDTVQIVSLPEWQWREYKKLRLEALQKDPQAFGKTYSQVAEYSDEKWQELLQSYLCLFAKVGNEFIGMIAIELNTTENLRHRGEIRQLYVRKEWRNKGVGEQLMNGLFSELKKLPYFRKVVLYVTKTQLSVQTLYKNLGFRTVGTLEKDIKIGDTFYDEYIMEKFI